MIKIQYSKHKQKNESFLAFYLCVSVLLIFSAAQAKNMSQEFDPVNLLNDSSASRNINIDKPVAKIERLSLDKKQIQTSGNIASNFTEVSQKTSSYLLMTQGPTTPQTMQLWKARISAPDDSASIQSKTQLRQMIKEINSIEFKPKQQSLEAAIDPNSKSQSKKTVVATSSTQKTIVQIENTPTNSQLTTQTLQILKDLSQHPEKIENPFDLAEILFNAGYLKEAAICYQQALKDIQNQSKTDLDKAWILFQIGNCLRKTDMPKALESYKKLIEQYPESQWTELAKAESTLISWFLENNPDAIVKQGKL